MKKLNFILVVSLLFSVTLFAQKHLPYPVKILEEKLQKYRSLVVLAVPETTNHLNYHGKTHPREQKVLLLPCMIPMRRREADSGIGLYLTFLQVQKKL